MKERIIILDFGSQYTQLIARRLRELHVFCEIYPYNALPSDYLSAKGIILSGSPFSVLDTNALYTDLNLIKGKLPVLGVCYGAQLTAHQLGGQVSKTLKREYGKARLNVTDPNDPIFQGISSSSQVWMSHGDSIEVLPEAFEAIATTDDIPVAAFRSRPGTFDFPYYCFQFHPEVTHSVEGMEMLRNFVVHVAGCHCDWNPSAYIEETISDIKSKVGDGKVLMGLSGGVDSTVAASLIHQAIGDRLTCVFLDNGLLRKGEFQSVLHSYRNMGFNIIGVDASNDFLSELDGVDDPETKRKIIGRVFIEVFQREAAKIEGVSWLGQGTIYPDVIESVSVHGPSVTIKSHHNVGGLPDTLHLKLIEPIRMLFKDEVRRVGLAMGIAQELIERHPFPGPGLAIRVLGKISRDKIRLCQDADAIFINKLREYDLYNKVWQAGAILLPVQSVGVMGDERTYEFTVALRCVNSVDGMTAVWSDLPYEFLNTVSSEIINNVKGINRVVYDISTKPPATIEWE
ncbi:MAG: glutamine-hydrolyzing GMP synthase [Saprospiraceae bacterium]|jgi:GMP synthase (glutamine-hydrolysing)|nr:glutamine-hydrolyzing GMP synthase [Saprospiraceae bacterium]MBP9193845.1 glutamine-hydrolyzing GMP synthase [Saprospiraceae bacterium]